MENQQKYPHIAGFENRTETSEDNGWGWDWRQLKFGTRQCQTTCIGYATWRTMMLCGDSPWSWIVNWSMIATSALQSLAITVNPNPGSVFLRSIVIMRNSRHDGWLACIFSQTLQILLFSLSLLQNVSNVPEWTPNSDRQKFHMVFVILCLSAQVRYPVALFSSQS